MTQSPMYNPFVLTTCNHVLISEYITPPPFPFFHLRSVCTLSESDVSFRLVLRKSNLLLTSSSGKDQRTFSLWLSVNRTLPNFYDRFCRKGVFIPSISVNTAMTLAILFSLKTMESLQNGFATHFQVTPLISMRTESLASSQSGRSVDADAWCKRALRVPLH